VARVCGSRLGRVILARVLLCVKDYLTPEALKSVRGLGRAASHRNERVYKYPETDSTPSASTYARHTPCPAFWNRIRPAGVSHSTQPANMDSSRNILAFIFSVPRSRRSTEGTDAPQANSPHNCVASPNTLRHFLSLGAWRPNGRSVSFLICSLLGRFRGQVCRCIHSRSGQGNAVKVILPAFASHPANWLG